MTGCARKELLAHFPDEFFDVLFEEVGIWVSTEHLALDVVLTLVDGLDAELHDVVVQSLFPGTTGSAELLGVVDAMGVRGGI